VVDWGQEGSSPARVATRRAFEVPWSRSGVVTDSPKRSKPGLGFGLCVLPISVSLSEGHRRRACRVCVLATPGTRSGMRAIRSVGNDAQHRVPPPGRRPVDNGHLDVDPCGDAERWQHDPLSRLVRDGKNLRPGCIGHEGRLHCLHHGSLVPVPDDRQFPGRSRAHPGFRRGDGRKGVSRTNMTPTSAPPPE
jgi:hypothetical protein